MSQAAETQPVNGHATDAPTGGAQSTADLSAIATDLAGTMPDVQEHAVQQAQARQRAQEAAPTDKTGAAFDPSTHVTGPDGKGVLTVRGTWAQKRGRKAGNSGNVGVNTPSVTKSTLGGPAAVTPAMQSAQQEQMAREAQSRAAGVAAAELLFMVGQMIGGEEWQPMENKAIGINERPLMHQAFGDYFVATGKTDIPPGAALAFAIVAYVAPRFAMPKTQTRFAKIKSGIAQWWTNRKLRKMGLEAQVTAKNAEGEKK